MILSRENLENLNACESAILFLERNSLINIDINDYEITGDYNRYYQWLKNQLKLERKYDESGKLTHFKNFRGLEYLYEYDESGNVTHYKNSRGFEEWQKYDESGNVTHYKNSDGFEEWYEYDELGNQIYIKNFSGFEKWKKYDKAGNVTHFKNSHGFEESYSFIWKNNIFKVFKNNKEILKISKKNID